MGKGGVWGLAGWWAWRDACARAGMAEFFRVGAAGPIGLEAGADTL